MNIHWDCLLGAVGKTLMWGFIVLGALGALIFHATLISYWVFDDPKAFILVLLIELILCAFGLAVNEFYKICVSKK